MSHSCTSRVGLRVGVTVRVGPKVRGLGLGQGSRVKVRVRVRVRLTVPVTFRVRHMPGQRVRVGGTWSWALGQAQTTLDF